MASKMAPAELEKPLADEQKSTPNAGSEVSNTLQHMNSSDDDEDDEVSFKPARKRVMDSAASSLHTENEAKIARTSI